MGPVTPIKPITIAGEVRSPREFNWADLHGLPRQIRERASFQGARREIAGVPLSALLQTAGVAAWARFVLVYGDARQVANVRLEEVERCTLVYAVDDVPLGRDLGGPVRLVADGLSRFADVSAVERIALSILPATIDHPFEHERSRAIGARLRASAERVKRDALFASQRGR